MGYPRTPKIDRIACPWLIRRFVEAAAVFLFVAPSDVEAVGEKFAAAPFDIEGVFWSHRGELCTFDVMIEELGLTAPPLKRLATIVRAAVTARLDLAPEAPGLLAASLGLSRMYSDDLEQLEAGLNLYDAFYRWCRDATTETHNWPTNKTKLETKACDDGRDFNSAARRATAAGSRRFLLRGVFGVAADCAVELRRPGRPDRGDASHPGR